MTGRRGCTRHTRELMDADEYLERTLTEVVEVVEVHGPGGEAQSGKLT